MVESKEAKFERGAAQAGPGIGLDFTFPVMYAHLLRWLQIRAPKTADFQTAEVVYREARQGRDALIGYILRKRKHSFRFPQPIPP